MQRRRVQALPAEWREHPELRDAYARAGRLAAAPVLISLSSSAFGWFAALSLVFAVLSVADFALGSLLLFACGVALFWTAAEVSRNTERVRRLVQMSGLSRPTRTLAQRAVNAVYWVPRFIVWLGFLGAACFLGRVVATPFT